jgi:hypothetical protein
VCKNLGRNNNNFETRYRNNKNYYLLNFEYDKCNSNSLVFFEKGFLFLQLSEEEIEAHRD